MVVSLNSLFKRINLSMNCHLLFGVLFHYYFFYPLCYKTVETGLTLRNLLPFVDCTTFIHVTSCVKIGFSLQNICINELIVMTLTDAMQH